MATSAMVGTELMVASEAPATTVIIENIGNSFSLPRTM